jgi:hypothetical protein
LFVLKKKLKHLKNRFSNVLPFTSLHLFANLKIRGVKVKIIKSIVSKVYISDILLHS